VFDQLKYAAKLLGVEFNFKPYFWGKFHLDGPFFDRRTVHAGKIVSIGDAAEGNIFLLVQPRLIGMGNALHEYRWQLPKSYGLSSKLPNWRSVESLKRGI